MVDPRPPEQVMTLARMGAGFPSRLGFMRSLLRRLDRENWGFDRTCFDVTFRRFTVKQIECGIPGRRDNPVGSHFRGKVV